MISPRAIQIWEQHAGQPPVCHAITSDRTAVPGVVHAWLSQFSNRVVGLHASDIEIVVCAMEWVGGRFDGRPVAALWIEYPDDVIRAGLPRWLDARWCGAARGMTWDTRDGTGWRVSR